MEKLEKRRQRYGEWERHEAEGREGVKDTNRGKGREESMKMRRKSWRKGEEKTEEKKARNTKGLKNGKDRHSNIEKIHSSSNSSHLLDRKC